MKRAVAILLAFAAVWAGLGLWAAGAPPMTRLAPAAASLALAALLLTRPAAARTRPWAPHVAGLVRFWLLAEFVLIAAAVILLRRLGQPELIGMAVSLIVGGHFFGLARDIPVRGYYATGAAMIAVGLVSLALPARIGPAFVGLADGVCLWATALWVARAWLAPVRPART
jgi:hypothetical protein